MTVRIAAWSLAFAVSLAVHSAVLLGLLGMAGTPGEPPRSELLIGDEAAFSAVVMSPIAAEAGAAEVIAEARPTLNPVENIASKDALAADQAAAPVPERKATEVLAPVDQSGEHVPPTDVGTTIAPSDQADKEIRHGVSKTIAALDDASAMPAVSEHASIAPDAQDLNVLPPAGQKSEPAAIVKSGAPVAPAPALPAKQIQSATQIASAQAAGGQVSSITAEPMAPERTGPSQSLVPAPADSHFSVLAESDAQLSQAPAQAVDAASPEAQHALASGEALDAQAAQETSVLAGAIAGHEVQAATDQGEQMERSESAISLGMVTGGEQVQAAAVGGKQIGRSESAEPVGAVAGNGQLQAATAAGERIERNETAVPVGAVAGNGQLQAAAAAGERIERNETAIPVGAVAGNGQLQAAAAAGQRIERNDTAVPLGAVTGTQKLTAVADESGKSDVGAASSRQPVESDRPALIAPPSAKTAALVIPEAQMPAANTTLAMVAPHPAIVLPPSTALSDDSALRMANFIRDYDGGFCFFAVPLALDTRKPQIDGYGSRADLIQSFGKAFERALGVEPALSVREITDVQCPAIGFIGKFLKSRIPEISVKLESDKIAVGSELKGTLDGVRLGHVILLFVDDDGMVHDVSQYLRRTVDGFEFAAPIYPTGEGKSRNQLIVAVAADREIGFTRKNIAISDEVYFSSIIRQANASGAAVAIGLSAFRVE